MCTFRVDDILCFACLKQVDACTIDGVERVCCSVCGNTVRVEEAQDDCFVFIVASAISPGLKSFTPHAYRFMPRLPGQDPRSAKGQMVDTRRAKSWAAAA